MNEGLEVYVDLGGGVKELHPDQVALAVILICNPFVGKEDRFRMFDIVSGSDHLRKSLMSTFNFEELTEYWNRDADQFKKLSLPYYLYK